MSAPTTISQRSPASASSMSYQSHADGYSSSIHKMISLYPYFYKYSAGTSYQINPDYEVHYVSLDSPESGGPHTLNLTLPYINAYPSSQCLLVIYLRNTKAGDFLTLTPIDTRCSINKGADGAAYSFKTDTDDHLFFVYGSYRPGGLGNYMNKYFVKQIQGREITISAGSGISVAETTFNYAISAFRGSPIIEKGATTAVNTAEYFGPGGITVLGDGGHAFMAPQDGRISNLYVHQLAVNGADLAIAYTLMDELIASPVTCTVGNSGDEAHDSIHFFDVIAGDRIQLRTVQTGTAAIKNFDYSFLFKPATV